MAEDIFSIPDVPKKRIGIPGTASSPASGSEPSISSAKSDTGSHPTVGTDSTESRAPNVDDDILETTSIILNEADHTRPRQQTPSTTLADTTGIGLELLVAEKNATPETNIGEVLPKSYLSRLEPIDQPKLAWPPTKEDLQHLYLEERLSAAKISKRYGVKSESVILKYLRLRGIPRRSCDEHNRKATKALVNEWARRYQQGESVIEIAGDDVNTSIIYAHLHKRGLVRSRSQAKLVQWAKCGRPSFICDKEDLRRLYVDQRLTARQIGQVYNLNCVSESAAESLVYHRLKAYGIERPSNRKYEAEAVEWANRYQNGESVQSIARSISCPAVIAGYLDRLGIKRRDISQARTKYRKVPFSGTEQEKAYLLGFARGDLHVRRDCRLIRVNTGSTHATQLDLFTSLFAPYGPIRVYPYVCRLMGYKWNITASLDKSFEFLLLERVANPSGILAEGSLTSYLAGLFDAEGSIWLRTDHPFSPFLSITNSDSTMLDWIKSFLSDLEFHPWRERPNADGVARVALWRNEEVSKLLGMLPIKHPEKRAMTRLVLTQTLPQSEKRKRWNQLLAEIEHDRNEFIRLSESECERKLGSAMNPYGLMACLWYLSHWRRFPLNESRRIETLLWLSEFVSH